MMRRVTITLDDKLDSKIRAIQAKKILEPPSPLAFQELLRRF